MESEQTILLKVEKVKRLCLRRLHAARRLSKVRLAAETCQRRMKLLSAYPRLLLSQTRSLAKQQRWQRGSVSAVQTQDGLRYLISILSCKLLASLCLVYVVPMLEQAMKQAVAELCGVDTELGTKIIDEEGIFIYKLVASYHRLLAQVQKSAYKALQMLP